MQREIGQLIRQVRQLRGLSQVDLAKKIGTSQSAMNRIENGKQNLSLKTLSRIGRALDYKFIIFNHPGEPRVHLSQNDKVQRLIVEIDKL